MPSPTPKSKAGGVLLRVDGVTVTVVRDPGVDTPRWWWLRPIAVGPGHRPIWLDDIDPYRDIADPVAPNRLGAAELAHWRRMYGAALTVIERAQPDIASAMACGLLSVVPLRQANRMEMQSASLRRRIRRRPDVASGRPGGTGRDARARVRPTSASVGSFIWSR